MALKMAVLSEQRMVVPMELWWVELMAVALDFLMAVMTAVLMVLKKVVVLVLSTVGRLVDLSEFWMAAKSEIK